MKKNRSKTFCVLSSGNNIDLKQVKANQKIFSTDFSDFYFLNWMENDNKSFICAPNCVWSEGISLLYEHVPKNYKYYIFINDDCEFQNKNGNDIAKTIKNILEKYTPLSASFHGGWHSNCIKNPINDAIVTHGFDLHAFVLEKTYANIIFPVIHHGSDASVNYAQYICHKLFPNKQILICEITTINSLHRTYSDNGKIDRFLQKEQHMELFEQHTVHKDYVELYGLHKPIEVGNKKLKNNKIDSEPIIITINDINKVYNTKNEHFLNRKSVHNSVEIKINS